MATKKTPAKSAAARSHGKSTKARDRERSLAGGRLGERRADAQGPRHRGVRRRDAVRPQQGRGVRRGVSRAGGGTERGRVGPSRHRQDVDGDDGLEADPDGRSAHRRQRGGRVARPRPRGRERPRPRAWLPFRAHQGADARDPAPHGGVARERRRRARRARRAGPRPRGGAGAAAARQRSRGRARGHRVACALAVRAARRRLDPHTTRRDPGRRWRRRRGRAPPARGARLARRGAALRRRPARLGRGRGRRRHRGRGDARDDALRGLRRRGRPWRRRSGELRNVGHAMEFVKDAYRHAKALLAFGAAGRCSRTRGSWSRCHRASRTRASSCTTTTSTTRSPPS